MPNINAALGCAQLEQIDEILANKRATAEAYMSFFANTDDVDFVVEPPHTKSNYWLNAILLKDRETRDAFLVATNDSGIATRPVWELMNRLTMFSHCQCGNLDNAVAIEERLVNLPSGVRKDPLK